MGCIPSVLLGRTMEFFELLFAKKNRVEKTAVNHFIFLVFGEEQFFFVINFSYSWIFWNSRCGWSKRTQNKSGKNGACPNTQARLGEISCGFLAFGLKSKLSIWKSPQSTIKNQWSGDEVFKQRSVLEPSLMRLPVNFIFRIERKRIFWKFIFNKKNRGKQLFRWYATSVSKILLSFGA